MMRSCCWLVGLSVVLGGAAGAAGAEPVQFRSPATQTPLLELYSSEGCSSCPPAEAWLSRLRAHPGLWRDFIPVAFHVDYWDRLGWRDSFGAARYSERQRAYAALWNRREVYTPGFVLDGVEWIEWLKRPAPGAGVRRPVGVLQVTMSGESQWRLRFDPSQTEPSVQWDLHAVLLGCGLTNAVLAGENRGRVLRHDFVVVADAAAPAASAGRGFEALVTLTRPAGVQPEALALVAWVTRRGVLPPVQAVGGWVPSNRAGATAVPAAAAKAKERP